MGSSSDAVTDSRNPSPTDSSKTVTDTTSTVVVMENKSTDESNTIEDDSSSDAVTDSGNPSPTDSSKTVTDTTSTVVVLENNSTDESNTVEDNNPTDGLTESSVPSGKSTEDTLTDSVTGIYKTTLDNNSSIYITRSTTMTNSSDDVTNAVDDVTKSLAETTSSAETSLPQCVLHPEILQTMCTSMMMKNVTVGQAGVTMRTEMMNIIENLFQHCDTRTFTVKVDFTLEF